MKSGAGTLTLAGASTLTGDLRVNGGTLQLGGSNLLADTAALVLAGGTFATSGHSETLGSLQLVTGSTIDFGSGASALAFADSSGLAWSGTLTLLNFTSGQDTLRFGTSSAGLTAAQLASVSFGGNPGQIDAAGFVTSSAVPEPSVWAGVAGASVLGVAMWRRRGRGRGKFYSSAENFLRGE